MLIFTDTGYRTVVLFCLISLSQFCPNQVTGKWNMNSILLILTAVIGFIVIFRPCCTQPVWCHLRHKQQRTVAVTAAV